MLWLIAASFLRPSSAAFCGSSAVPYSFEVLPGGGTVLGCARPACFGWDPASGNHASQDSSFIEQQGYQDGYLRSQDPPQRPPFVPEIPQMASCLPAMSCTAGQWIGGFIGGQGGAVPSVMCCSHQQLLTAQDRGVAPLHPGEIAYGGEIQENGLNYFDYLRNVQPIRGADGQIAHYDVEMGRMSCPEPRPLPAALPIAPQQIYQPPVPVQAPAAYVPSYGYGAAVAPMAYMCFAADSTVTTVDGIAKRMDEVTIRDYILSPAWNYSGVGVSFVTEWLHRMEEVDAEFLIIGTKSGKEVKLTRRHFIMKAACDRPQWVEMVPAEEILPGDCLLEMVNNDLFPSPVTRISSTFQKGIYAPLTDTGRLIVDGIAASCYSEIDDAVFVRRLGGNVIDCKQRSSLIMETPEDDLHCSLDDQKFELLLDLIKLVLPSSL